MKDKATLEKIQRARATVLLKQPFFGCLALHMGLVEVTDEKFVSTMAVDGVNMYYWPPFVNSLVEEELEGVVAHEVMHCVYRHMTRRGSRHPVIWNWAGDFRINDDLLEANFTLPKKRLHDKKYHDMTTEEIYQRIYDETPKIKISFGSGEGLPEDADKGGCGGVLDAGAGLRGDQSGSGTSPGEIEAEWDQAVRMAVNTAKRHYHAGNMPAYLKRLIDVLGAPKVSWRDLTRQFIDGHMTKDYSWSYPNRRFVSSGLILPGYVNDSLHHLVMLGDVSGSISDSIMQAYLNEVSGALNDGVADRLTIAYFDTEIKKVDEFLPGDLVTCDVPGGGGTDFRPAFDWVTKNAQDASCIVCLTDMMPNTWKIPDPGIPVLWGAWLPAAMLAGINPPFGQVVQIDGAD